jgi:hypothetical protein
MMIAALVGVDDRLRGLLKRLSAMAVRITTVPTECLSSQSKYRKVRRGRHLHSWRPVVPGVWP